MCKDSNDSVARQPNLSTLVKPPGAPSALPGGGSPYEVGATVFVGGLPRNCSDEELEAAFRHFGPLKCTVKRNELGQPRGFGFVRFETAEAAGVAVSENGKIIVRDKVVDVQQNGTPSAQPASPQISDGSPAPKGAAKGGEKPASVKAESAATQVAMDS